jgi:uncharacterized protein (TIGR00645 family)
MPASGLSSPGMLRLQKDLMSNKTARAFEAIAEACFFNMRWLAAPLYLGLGIGLIVVPIKFAQVAWHLLAHAWVIDFDDVFVGVLDLIDLVLLANLLLIVMFAGYENFVSRLDVREHPDFPRWIGHVTFGDIKLKLMASIVAMSAIHVLADFIRVDQISDRVLAWSVGLHLAFIISGLIFAWMDRITEGDVSADHDHPE